MNFIASHMEILEQWPKRRQRIREDTREIIFTDFAVLQGYMNLPFEVSSCICKSKKKKIEVKDKDKE